MNVHFDVLIAGAGPAGSAAAIALSSQGLSIAVLDKASFPRDKICGDALSVDVINQIRKLSPEMLTKLSASPSIVRSSGVRIISPGNDRIDLPFIHNGNLKSGYISQRLHFDKMLFDHMKLLPGITVMENCEVTNIVVDESSAVVTTSSGTFTGSFIIGADGVHSAVKKLLLPEKLDRKHHSAGLRVYYENVKGFHNDNFIELYFLSNILPGYLWIFPLPENKANVGIGMLSSVVSAKKVNLQKVLAEALASHPMLKSRFLHARPLESVKGLGLPLGSRKRTLSGNRFVLTGDAASLIDPFSGEGIGNALRSGRIAADHVANAFRKNDFSATFNQKYDREVYHRMGKEFVISRSLQNLCRFPRLFNAVVRKANRNADIHQALTDALSNSGKKEWLTKPSFYLHLLFN